MTDAHPLEHMGFREAASGLLVPHSAGPAMLDADGRERAAHRDLSTSEGGIVYPRRARPSCIDVFCGCGGFSLGVENAGFEVVAAIDLEICALATYWNNLAAPDCRWHGDRGTIGRGKDKQRVPDDYPPGRGHTRNVIRADVAELSADELLRIVDLPRGGVDLMHGSPPCQGFSTANSRRFIDDPRNALYREFVRLVAGVRPKHISMENVPQLLTFGDAWQHIQQDLRDLGYAVSAKILDAWAYGVPQYRPRAWVSANRVGNDPWWPLPTNWGDHDLRAFKQFPELEECIGAADHLTADPQPTELCMVMPTSGYNDGPYMARLIEHRGNHATLVDPFGGRHEVLWTTVLGFGAHTRQQLSLFDMAVGGDL